MDEKRMKLPSFETLPAWAIMLSLTAHLAAGIGIGVLYFNAVWWSARMFARRGPLGANMILIVGRLSVLGALLAGASREGAGPLLAMAIGVLVTRPLVIRGRREAAL
jgi:hypothetical protein